MTTNQSKMNINYLAILINYIINAYNWAVNWNRLNRQLTGYLQNSSEPALNLCR